MIISSYDYDQDGVLNYQEFLNMIITNNNPGLKKLSLFKNKGKQVKVAIGDVLYTFLKLFIKEIEFAKKINALLSENKNDISARKVFEQIISADTTTSTSNSSATITHKK